MSTGLSLTQQLREDFETHSRRRLMPGLHALLVHRIGVWRLSQPAPLRTVVGVLYKLVNILVIQNVYGIEVHDTTRIGRRVRIAHHVGVVLGPGSVIGDDVLIRHGVTLGRSTHQGPDDRLPQIGNRVEIGAGAIILGGVTVGDGARIGPGAVVMTDVPAGASAFAALARVMRPPGTGPAPAASSRSGGPVGPVQRGSADSRRPT